MSNFLGQFQSYSQLPAIDNSDVFPGDSAYTLDDGCFWIAKQPSAPPGALPQWLFIDTLRGAPGPQGEAGVGLPGPQGQIGPPGQHGGTGPQGPAGRSAFSFLSVGWRVPDVDVVPHLTSVSDTSWMVPGLLIFIPGAGTFTVVGSPPDLYTVNLVNSGDPNNAPAGTMIAAGTAVSPASMRGPSGPEGQIGPAGPPGPQGVSGTSVYTTLKEAFSIPATSAVAFANVLDSTTFAAGQIVYIEGGDYFAVQATDDTTNTLTLVNQNYPGGAPAGTIIPIGNTISGTGPQGPQGLQGIPGPQGPQGIQGVAMTGTVTMWPTAVSPGGWLICNGQAVSRTQYPDLFAILSTSWGAGDGVSTFNVPDMRDVFPVGASATKALGSAGGEAAHALTIAELAIHAHAAAQPDHYHLMANHTHVGVDHLHSLSNHVHSYSVFGAVAPGAGFNLTPGGGFWVGINQINSGVPSIPVTGAADRSLTPGPASPNTTNPVSQSGGIPAITVANTGSGTAHNNMPPYRAINFIIKA